MDVHVGRLRKAVNTGKLPDVIRTIRGSGYSDFGRLAGVIACLRAAWLVRARRGFRMRRRGLCSVIGPGSDNGGAGDDLGTQFAVASDIPDKLRIFLLQRRVEHDAGGEKPGVAAFGRLQSRRDILRAFIGFVERGRTGSSLQSLRSAEQPTISKIAAMCSMTVTFVSQVVAKATARCTRGSETFFERQCQRSYRKFKI